MTNTHYFFPAALVLGLVVLGAIWLTKPALGAQFPDPRLSLSVTASTTAYSLTWGATATRIVATSTPDGTRVALELQPVNCGTGGVVYLAYGDKVAATSTGSAVFASTTMVYGDQAPIVAGSVRAMSAVASCTLLVTEYRTAK